MPTVELNDSLIYDIYKNIYAAADPPADFGKMYFLAKTDEYGNKVIDYKNHYLHEDDLELIIRKTIENARIKGTLLINKYVNEIKKGPIPEGERKKSRIAYRAFRSKTIGIGKKRTNK